MAVSDLAYDPKLKAADAATLRHLEGATAGVECVLVEHSGNSTASIGESREVVAEVNRHLCLPLFDGSGAVRPLEEKDILIVAAYNAQVDLICTQLDAAGFRKARVGTVDRFQGQEAAVVIVSWPVPLRLKHPAAWGSSLTGTE